MVIIVRNYLWKNDRILVLVRENSKLVTMRSQLQQAASDAVDVAMRASDTAKSMAKKAASAEKEKNEMNNLAKEVQIVNKMCIIVSHVSFIFFLLRVLSLVWIHINIKLVGKLTNSEEAKEGLEEYASRLKKERDHLRELLRRLQDPNSSAYQDMLEGSRVNSFAGNENVHPSYAYPYSHPLHHHQHQHQVPRQQNQYIPKSSNHSNTSQPIQSRLPIQHQQSKQQLDSYLFSRKPASQQDYSPQLPPQLPASPPIRDFGSNSHVNQQQQQQQHPDRQFVQDLEDEDVQNMLNVSNTPSSDPLLAYLSPTSSPAAHTHMPSNAPPQAPPIQPTTSQASQSQKTVKSTQAPSPTPSTTSTSSSSDEGRAALAMKLEHDMAELDVEINGLKRALELAAKKSTQAILAQVSSAVEDWEMRWWLFRNNLRYIAG
jgi:hypothetical protein